MQKGKIGVTTENIFPVIKKFLYSDNEIFLREIVSNAVDATQKLKTLSMSGELKEEAGDLSVRVKVDKKTITVTDRGIGMTAEELDKYINQIAFSGANDFLEKYKDSANAIIGHFGLGFYSAFMVSKKVEIITKSYKKDSKAVKWSCDGSPEFSMIEVDKEDRGTDIILHIDKESKEYLDEDRIETLLKKYCRFLPVPIVFGKKKEWKNGENVETDQDNVINNTEPIWTKTPTELKDEDYKKFYRELYPMSDEPLFWIHLNVDYPFNLTGVLYFPKIKSNLELQKNKIQLFCNQVYVTDSVEGIVQDFLTLLHGVIDSPDIPLNVSRSYLQSDSNVKKISGYITKKVADRLSAIFKSDRKEFQNKWDDLKLFMNYGMLTDEDFYKKIENIALFKDTDGSYFTYKEYKKLILDNQTDKEKNLIYLYANNKDDQFGFIESAKNRGYSVLLMDNNLDVAMVGMLEQKFESSRFLRVDSDSIDNLIKKEDKKSDNLSKEISERVKTLFNSQLPKLEKVEFHVDTQSLGESSQPVIITQSEYMRRMKDMSVIQSGMSFYGEMPDMFTIVINSDHSLVKNIIKESEANYSKTLDPLYSELKTIEEKEQELNKLKEENKEENKEEKIISEREKQLSEVKTKIAEKRSEIESVITDYANENKIIHELIDLALLQNNMLKGESLNVFIKRSLELIK